jgi:raffinose/stachyose/melibiose transport system permease protein
VTTAPSSSGAAVAGAVSGRACVGRRRGGRRRRVALAALKYALLTLFALTTVLLPLWLMVVNSFKPQGEANELGVGLPHTWAIAANYGTVYHDGDFLRGLMNTTVVTLPALAGMLLFGSFAAWIFARGRSRTIRALYYLSIVGILVPPAIVGAVLVLRWYGIYGSRFGLVLFYMGIFMSFAIFFITGFIKTIPYELEESARIDGAGPLRIFRKIILPLLAPILATTFVVLLLFMWNDFIYPFYILNSSSQRTLTLGLYNFVSGYQYEIKWNLVFADVVLVSLPLVLVYFLAQRRVLSGLMGGAVNK